MKLLLARHGNTFSPDMTPVFVGARDDMPLVEEGLRQAERFAQLLRLRSTNIDAVYCGPLKRTRQFAEIVISSLQLPSPPVIDERLNELDYGEWSGKTNDEVIARFGEDVLAGWNDNSIWPHHCGWQSSPEEIAQQAATFVKDLNKKYSNGQTVLLVSSNGRLRYFLKMVPAVFDQKAADKSLKVAPGNFCQMDFTEGKASLDFWNESPKAALKATQV